MVGSNDMVTLTLEQNNSVAQKTKVGPFFAVGLEFKARMGGLKDRQAKS